MSRLIPANRRLHIGQNCNLTFLFNTLSFARQQACRHYLSPLQLRHYFTTASCVKEKPINQLSLCIALAQQAQVYTQDGSAYYSLLQTLTQLFFRRPWVTPALEAAQQHAIRQQLTITDAARVPLFLCQQPEEIQRDFQLSAVLDFWQQHREEDFRYRHVGIFPRWKASKGCHTNKPFYSDGGCSSRSRKRVWLAWK